MPLRNDSRRDFMKTAGALFAGAAVGPTNAMVPRGPEGAPATPFDVKSYGATGDGKTIDSPAINRAIEAAAESGGGTVLFPPGSYLCYSIRLKSKVTLNLSSGSVIVA